MNFISVLVFLGMLSSLLPSAVRAQFMIKLDLEKTTFLSQEPMVATVSISNRSGGDVVMGGARDANWLQFYLEESSGRQFPPVGVEVEEPFVFTAGATMKRLVEITNTTNISDVGSYAVTAMVYHAPSGKHYQSNRFRFSIVDTKADWEQPFGVPAPYEGQGRIRIYSLHKLREDEGTKLYFRLTDDRSQLRLATFSLGPVSLAIDPVFVVDRANCLQVFMLAAPRIFSHTIIGPDGKVISRKYYRDLEDNRPTLVSQGGELVVAGGLLFDPAAPTAEEMQVDTARSASDRPPGL